MHLKIWLTLGVASLATAARMDVPAVRGVLIAVNSGFIEIDKPIRNMTVANVNTTISQINVGLKDLGKALSDASAALRSSRPLSAFDFLTLASPLQSVARTLEVVAGDLASKRMLIIKAGQADRLLEGLRAAKPGIIALNNGVQYQLSAVVGIKPADSDKIMDSSLIALISIFKGESATISFPAGIWPLEGAPKRRSIRKSMSRYGA